MRRPSKSSIVNASISHLGLSREQRLLATKELRTLFATAEELLGEVNDWRTRNGLAPRSMEGWTEGCEQIASVERETFGAFLDCDGQEDGDEDQDGDQDQDGEMDNEASASASAYDAFAQANSSIEESVRLIPDMHRASFASFATSMHQSPDLNMFVNPQSSGMAPFRSIPINSQSRLSFASNTGCSDMNTSYHQPQPRTQSHHVNGMNAFLADSFDQNSLQSTHSQQSPLDGSGSLAGSNAEGGVVTPPPMHSNARQHVNTFIDSPPASTVAATSFSLGHNTGDKVSDWAAQQMMLQFGDASQGLDACSPFDQSGAGTYFQQMGQAKNGMNRPRQNSLLPAAHRSLMVAQPHLAAAVFPPAGSSSPPFSTPGGDMYASPLVQPGSFESQSPIQGQFINAAAQQAQSQIVQAAAGLGLNAEQLEHWKRYAMQSFLTAQANPQQATGAHQAPTFGELREAVRAGMTVGMGLAANQWPQDHLESFA